MSRPRRKPGICRSPQREPRCEAITPAMRAIEDVPPFACWRVSWLARRGSRDVRVSAYLLTDAGARGWCERQGIPFPGDTPAAPAPMSCAHDPDYGDHVVPARAPRSTGEASPLVDFKARGAGEEA